MLQTIGASADFLNLKLIIAPTRCFSAEKRFNESRNLLFESSEYKKKFQQAIRRIVKNNKTVAESS